MAGEEETGLISVEEREYFGCPASELSAGTVVSCSLRSARIAFGVT